MDEIYMQSSINLTQTFKISNENQSKVVSCRLQSISSYRDHFVGCLSALCVCLSVSHTFLVVTSYVFQATHAFLGILPFWCKLFNVCEFS